MNLKDRKDITQSIYNQTMIILEGKGNAYSSKEDTLSNFKKIASSLNLTKYQIWSVYFNKHIDAINNAIKDYPEYPEDKTEGMKGRIFDAINYLTILYCLLHEDNNI